MGVPFGDAKWQPNGAALGARAGYQNGTKNGGPNKYFFGVPNAHQLGTQRGPTYSEALPHRPHHWCTRGRQTSTKQHLKQVLVWSPQKRAGGEPKGTESEPNGKQTEPNQKRTEAKKERSKPERSERETKAEPKGIQRGATQNRKETKWNQTRTEWEPTGTKQTERKQNGTEAEPK